MSQASPEPTRAEESARVSYPKATIDAKPAAGLFGGAVATVGLGLLTRYTGYDPTVEEAGGVVIIVTALVSWIVPSDYWSRG